MRSLKKYIYPTLSDRVYEILGENYFLILYPVLLFFIIAEKYLNIISFDGLVYFTLLLLRRKLVYLDFFFADYSAVIWIKFFFLQTSKLLIHDESICRV